MYLPSIWFTTFDSLDLSDALGKLSFMWKSNKVLINLNKDFRTFTLFVFEGLLSASTNYADSVSRVIESLNLLGEK